MSVSQALAEAFTTSAKGMVGRRLLQCSDLSYTYDPGDLFGGIGGAIIDAGTTVGDGITDAGGAITGVGTDAGGAITDAGGAIGGAFSGGGGFGRRLFSLPSDKTMSTKRQLITIGFESQCNTIVNTFKATWDTAKKQAVDAVEATARAAAAAATTLLNEVKDAAKAAAAAATKTLNEVKDAAEKAAATATNFIDDVGNAFSELGKEIQCAAPPLPLPPPAPL